MMFGLRGGQTPREFGVTPASLEAYLEVHPEYAREARPLIEANAKVAYLRRARITETKRIVSTGIRSPAITFTLHHFETSANVGHAFDCAKALQSRQTVHKLKGQPRP